MYPNRDLFSTYKIVAISKVFIGNNTSYKVVDVGTVKIRMFNCVVKILSGVRNVSDLKNFFLNALDAKGYKYTCEGRVYKISIENLIEMI